MSFKHFLPEMIAYCGVCIFVISVGAMVQQLSLYRDIAYDDLLPQDVNVSLSMQTEKKIHCAKSCQEEEWCNSFFYNVVERECLRQRVVYLAPPRSDVTTKPGWQYFRLKSELVCPSDIYIADRLTRTCYRVDWSKQKWISARDACAANGERLVVLEPVTKAEFIRDFLNANKDRYLRSGGFNIGAQRSGGDAASGPEFDWVNGEPVNMTATQSFRRVGTFKYMEAKDVLVIAAVSIRWIQADSLLGRRSLCEQPFLSD